MAKKSDAKKKTIKITPSGMQKAAGSDSLDVQTELLQQAINALWQPDWKSEEERVRGAQSAYEALQRIAPKSELEGMLAVQMIGTHNAAMECLRRAMVEQQTFEGRDQNLKHATKLMSIYERQLAALDKHRGKGKQKITVEHVNVHAGGQAIVGDVNAPGKNAEGNEGSEPPALEDESSGKADGENLKKALAAKPAREPRS